MTDVVARSSSDLAIGSDTPATVSVSPGGSAANVAAWAATLGVSTCLVARIGDDTFGRQARDDLLASGVEPWLCVDLVRPTGTCVIVVTPDGERTMLPDPGANESWALSDVPDRVIATARHLHVVGYALLRAGARSAALHALAVAREHGVTVSVDPSSAAPLAEVGAHNVLAWTRGADLCFPNLDEARVLTGLDDPRDAAAALTDWYAEVVLTLGPGGALWAGRGGPPIHRAAEPTAVVDSTGAGDAFAAAYLAARLGGAEPAACLDRATSIAARAVQRAGARPGRQ
jgi:sugar/nucleoside kinase (ribokinase family)